MKPWERGAYDRKVIDAGAARNPEGAKAHDGLVIYCELGSKRSLQQVARRLQKSTTQIGKWSRTWRWGERAAAWDRERDRDVEKIRRDDRRRRMGKLLKMREEADMQQLRAASDLLSYTEEYVRSLRRLPVITEQTDDDGRTVITEGVKPGSVTASATALKAAAEVQRAAIDSALLQNVGAFDQDISPADDDGTSSVDDEGEEEVRRVPKLEYSESDEEEDPLQREG